MKIIAEQVLILSIIGFIGFIASKLKFLTTENRKGLSKVIMKITLPFLIFTTFAGTKLNNEMLIAFPYIFGAAFVSVFIFYHIASLSAKIQKFNKSNTALHQTSTMFGNVIFMGFPLLNALFPGGEGLIYATIFQISHESLVWTAGVFILNKASEHKSRHTWRHLLNPTTAAFILGVIFLIFKIKIPQLIHTPIYGLGHTTIYLSMLYVGAILSDVNAKALLTNLRSYVVSFNKLIIGPTCVMAIFYTLKLCGVNIPPKGIICAVLQSAMPCMIIISVLAQELGLNSKQSVENIFVSSILSIFTLPALYYILTLIF